MTEAPSAGRAGSPKIDAEKFNALVAHAIINRIRLASNSFQVQPEAFDETAEAVFKIKDKLQEFRREEEPLLLIGTYRFDVTRKQGRRVSVKLSAEYVATFKLSQSCEDEAAFAFLTRIGRFSCYPYFRALFAVLTESSGLQLPPLPVIKEQPRLVKA